MNSNTLACVLAQNVAELLVTSWHILSHQSFPPKCDSQEFLSPSSHCHSFSCATPSSHHSKTSTAAVKKWLFILIPPAVSLYLLVLWCPSGGAGVNPSLAHTPGFLALLKNSALSSLSNAPVTVCVSGHEPSQKHMTEMVLYWLQLSDRKKKVKNRLWMQINTVWELWVIRDIRFPADVFIP